MKKKLFIIAALFALFLTGCAKDNSEIETEPKMVTVSVTMTSPDDDGTRVSLTPDGLIPHGFILKWETTDKLMLCFEYIDGATTEYFYGNANIDPNSIINDGKTADFTFTVPQAIPLNQNFNLYAVYQKTNNDGNDGGYFVPNTKKYFLEQSESTYITLNQPTNPRPMLYYSKGNIANTANPDIGPINLSHAGWMMALHFKNISANTIDLPLYIYFSALVATCVHNGDHPTLSTTYFDFDFSSNCFFSSTPDEQNIYLSINKPNMPLYGGTLAPNESIIFYRWIASGLDYGKLEGFIEFPNGKKDVFANLYSARPVTYGKVYHFYTTWDGFNFERTTRY